jgi:predicted nucleic acid-binding protein
LIVVDASAAVLALLNDGDARRALTVELVAVPHLVDGEVVHALRGQVRRRAIRAEDAASALAVWARLGLLRFGLQGLLDRVWALRANLSAYDAGYVALAEALGCALVTADGRLARAPGAECTITVLRR